MECRFYIDDLELLCQQPVKAIVINFPHNRVRAADHRRRITTDRRNCQDVAERFCFAMKCSDFWNCRLL